MGTKRRESGGDPRSAVRQRRTYNTALKREMVEATLAGGESVSVVARRYDVNANQLFRWRREYREGLLADDSDSACVWPITVVSPKEPALPGTLSQGVAAESMDRGRLEISFHAGHRLVVTGTVCDRTLCTVLEALSR